MNIIFILKNKAFICKNKAFILSFGRREGNSLLWGKQILFTYFIFSLLSFCFLGIFQ